MKSFINSFLLLLLFLVALTAYGIIKSNLKEVDSKPKVYEDVSSKPLSVEIPLEDSLEKMVENTTAFARTSIAELAFISKNYNEAFKLLQNKKGNLNSTEQWHIAFLNLHGFGTKRNYAEAKNWLEQSDAANNPRGTALLGYIYEEGLGVTKDLTQAIKYYEKAIQADDPLAMNNLGYLNQYGLGLSTNIEKAVKLYKQAADQGWALAENNLGWMYLTSYKQQNVPAAKALKLITSAAVKNERLAFKNLNKIYRQGIGGIPIDENKANYWAHKEDLFNCHLETITTI